MKAYIVIGMGYGDEGKGKMVDYLCDNVLSQGKSVGVIRYNGGAQAGHTVVTDTKTQIFHHIGSGSLLGVDTFLGSHFFVNPTMFVNEDLNDCSVSVHPLCRITTPFDMILNQKTEGKRSETSSIHGSCGLGVYETKVRTRVLPLTVESFIRMGRTEFFTYLGLIENYFFEEVRQRDISLSDEDIQFLRSDALKHVFYNNCIKTFSILKVVTLPSDKDVYVFEGAQGLLLNKRYGEYPYLTPSDPGVTYPLQICKDLGIFDVEIIFTTRAYTTRHGSGPLHGQCAPELLGLHNTYNETNVLNIHQGNFRYAPFYIGAIHAAQQEYLRIKEFPGIYCVLSVSLTCVDQVSFDVSESVQTHLCNFLNPSFLYVSDGPMRSHIHRREILG
jgi:adenylosuccinate synthase